MFQRLDSGERRLSIDFEGQTIAAEPGDTVAAALIAAGIRRFRETAVSGSPRAPYCMMGVCFECLVTVDGVGNRQGCLVPVKPGVRIDTQHGKREVGR
jgi:sarcosine oxidase subunit alpha